MCERRGRVPSAFAACESAELRIDATTFSSDCHRRGKTQMRPLRFLALRGSTSSLRLALTRVRCITTMRNLTMSSNAAWLGRVYVLWNLLRRLEGSAYGKGER